MAGLNKSARESFSRSPFFFPKNGKDLVPLCKAAFETPLVISAAGTSAPAFASAAIAAEESVSYAFGYIFKRGYDSAVSAARAFAVINIHGHVYVFRTDTNSFSEII